VKSTMKRTCLLAAVCSLFLAGCTAKYHQEVIDQNTMKLKTGKGVFISVPRDGFYGPQRYPNSGEMTAQAIKEAFARYTHTIEVSSECQGEGCLDGISSENYTYYVCPDILHWEERATEWSCLPDQIRVKIVIYAVDDRSVISSVILQGKSKTVSLGGDHPQDLLPEPISQYLSTLYGGS